MLIVALGSTAAFRRWWRALETVSWVDGRLEFRRGTTVLTLDPDALTEIDSCPSAVRTRLRAGPHLWTLSHRLVRVDELLERLRNRRPDLFAAPEGPVVLTVSVTTAVFQAVLALGTAGAGWLLAPWQPWLGGALAAAAAFALFRVFWYIPRGYTVSEGSLTVRYALRRRVWPRPRSIREDAYAAGGAVFFRMRLAFGPRSVVLDEGQLLQPLRPLADRIAAELTPIPSD
jgi:hypothetical protein